MNDFNLIIFYGDFNKSDIEFDNSDVFMIFSDDLSFVFQCDVNSFEVIVI